MGWPAGKAWTWRRAARTEQFDAPFSGTVELVGCDTYNAPTFLKVHPVCGTKATILIIKSDDGALAHDAAARRLHGSARDGRQTGPAGRHGELLGMVQATIPTSPSGVTARWSTTWIIAARHRLRTGLQPNPRPCGRASFAACLPTTSPAKPGDALARFALRPGCRWDKLRQRLQADGLRRKVAHGLNGRDGTYAAACPAGVGVRHALPAVRPVPTSVRIAAAGSRRGIRRL